MENRYQMTGAFMNVSVSNRDGVIYWQAEDSRKVQSAETGEAQTSEAVETKASSGMQIRSGVLGKISHNGSAVRWTDLQCTFLSTKLCVFACSEDGGLTLSAEFEAFPDMPFLRVSGHVTAKKEQVITDCAIFSCTPDCTLPSAMFYVEQFSAKYQRDFFRPITARLIPNRVPHEIPMGCMPSFHWGPTACTWFAVLPDEYGWYGEEPKPAEGLVFGIEFNGKSHARGWADDHEVHFESTIDDLHHPMQPGDVFEIPAFFIGRFDGDWDEAGYRTQRFLEAHVCPKMPDDRYPWVQYNSWAYDQDINEEQQLAAIDVCGKLGMELIVLDLGWAENIGDWRPNKKKFPRGFKPLIERAASYGMKFGVHLALAQCSPDAPIAHEHPEWMIGESIDYYGAMALCLGHKPCRAWLIGELTRLIAEEGITYFVQDGEDMVKRCTRTDHTHDCGDSNYANSQEGLDVVISTLRERFPDLVIENCEDGGNMMTYKMARLYHTSITVDNIDTYSTRQGIYGASYPFPPRYSVRYMEDAPTHYSLYSSVFGGPLIFMHRVTEWNEREIRETGEAIGLYKKLRELVKDAKIIHLMRPSRNFDGGYGWDAIQAVNAGQTESVVMVYRAKGGEEAMTILPRGLNAECCYEVRLQDGGESRMMTGEVIMTEGISVKLAEKDAEILWIKAV